MEVRVEEKLRIRTKITPRTDLVWSAVVVQERRVVWKGQARRGEIDQRFPNLPGAESLSVRLTQAGSVCVVDMLLPE